MEFGFIRDRLQPLYESEYAVFDIETVSHPDGYHSGFRRRSADKRLVKERKHITPLQTPWLGPKVHPCIFIEAVDKRWEFGEYFHDAKSTTKRHRVFYVYAGWYSATCSNHVQT